MDNSDKESILNASLQRCIHQPEFMSRFYRHFIESSPEIRDLFQQTDMKKQFEMMSKSLMTMIAASEANWLNDQELTTLAQKHKNLKIKPEHYELWENSLLESIKECDPEYSEVVRNAWKFIIKRGKDFMQNN